jgi:hypothetical protein
MDLYFSESPTIDAEVHDVKNPPGWNEVPRRHVRQEIRSPNSNTNKPAQLSQW